jgi:hypothetical protein
MSVRIQIEMSWNMTPCSDVRPAATSFTMKMEEIWFSKTMLSYYITTRCHDPEDHDMNHHCENLVSHLSQDVRFEVFMAVKIQIEDFRVVSPCNVVVGYPFLYSRPVSVFFIQLHSLHPEEGDSKVI